MSLISPEAAVAPISTRKSGELYTRAERVLPGGVNSPVRSMSAIGRDYPIFIERGEGAEIIDVDANRYIDYVCSWGPLIHGHAHPRIVEAIKETASRGTSFGAPTVGEIELAELIVNRVPGVEVVRLTSSGTEASMSALRLARAVTGRTVLLKFSGAYHGHVDSLLSEAGSGLATQGIPSSPGVTASVVEDTIVIPWNDPKALEEVFDRYRFAAVIAEPYPANMGLVPPEDGFLELLRKLTTDNGALLIFDEVISGFRVASGGGQELSGVVADISVMGKVVGGGLPVGAFGASREIMSRIAPVGDVYQAGTLSGNPLAVSAGIACLKMLDESSYVKLAEITEELATGLKNAAGECPVQVHYLPGLLTVFFSEHPVHDYATAASCDRDLHGAWCRALLERGIYSPPSQFEAWFPSLAHGPEHVARTIEAARAAFADVL